MAGEMTWWLYVSESDMIRSLGEGNSCMGGDSLYGSSMQKHQWRDGLGEDQVLFRATHHAGRWELYSQLKGDEAWTHYDPIPKEHLEKLRELIWNKYQRGRCPHKFITQIDKLLGKD